MTRVTRKQLEGMVENVNRGLERAGSCARVTVEQRYDYHALDLTTADYLENHPGAAIRTLRIGRTGEIADYLRAMLEAIWLPADYPVDVEKDRVTAS